MQPALRNGEDRVSSTWCWLLFWGSVFGKFAAGRYIRTLGYLAYDGHPVEDARRSEGIRLVSRSFQRMPHALLLVAGDLRRSKLEGQLVDLAGELERQLVAVIHSGAAIDADVECLVE